MTRSDALRAWPGRKVDRQPEIFLKMAGQGKVAERCCLAKLCQREIVPGYFLQV